MKKNHILVVDDEPFITRELKAQLEHTGRFEVRAENSAAAALQALRTFHPDMAILDVMMPDMDGGELKYRLRCRPELQSLPVAYLTAAKLRAEHNDKELFIEKPVEIERIIKVIDQQLGKGMPATA
jgi:two-component system, OmpR family, response regulator